MEPSGAVIQILVGVNTVLLAIVGVFFMRLIRSLDEVSKRQQDIELKHVEMQGRIAAITDRLIDLLKMIGIPERVVNLESQCKKCVHDIDLLRERQHDVANAINNVVIAVDSGEVKLKPFHLKDWEN